MPPKDGSNMEEMLKKMLEESKKYTFAEYRPKPKETCDHCGGDLDGDEELYSAMSGVKAALGFLEKGELIRLANVANAKMDTIFEELASILKMHDSDKNKRAVAAHMIIRKAEELRILKTFMIAAGASVLPAENDGEKMDLIVKLCK